MSIFLRTKVKGTMTLRQLCTIIPKTRFHSVPEPARMLLVVVAITVTALWSSPAPIESAVIDIPAGRKDLDVVGLQAIVDDGHGQDALEKVARFAFAQGGWTPAPDDQLIFDPSMHPLIRGAVIDYDEIPDVCYASKLDVDAAACIRIFRAKEQQVRFGPALFETDTPDGSDTRSPDDVLATFIEESGHSWQEYAFETDGRMALNRTRSTTIKDALFWRPGREYQVKMYILNLDGQWLNLSSSLKATLYDQLCAADGYANPLGHAVPPYGPPPDWVNPDGWPTATPTDSQHFEFCTT